MFKHVILSKAKDLLLILMVLGSMWGCGGDRERPETIDRLRTLGVAANPLVSTPSPAGGTVQTVTLDVYAAVPLGVDATLAPYKDTQGGLTYDLPETDIAVTQPVAADYTDLTGFRLLKAQAVVNVPSEAVIAMIPNAEKGVRVRYGVKVTAGARAENIVGSFMVYPAGAPELAWTHPVIDIATPTDQGSVTMPEKGTEVKASVTNNNDEETKVGWFASSGEIINRRAHETKWKEAKEGLQNLVVTAHGKKSRGFALKVIQVTVQP